MSTTILWAESALAAWQEGDSYKWVSEHGAPSWEQIIGTILQLSATNTDLLEALEAILPHASHRIRGTTVGQPILDKAQQAIEKARN